MLAGVTLMTRIFALTPALNMAVFEMVSVPVTTVRVGSTDDGAD
jgi:hypothetical protein